MQQLDSVEYKQQLALLNAQIKVFESKVVLGLRANIK